MLLEILPVLVAVLFLLLFLRFLASPAFKGWLGERAVILGGLGKLDPARYRHFHDLYLPRPDGSGTTQIDHVVVSPFGIFVIETKNLRGWIFGSEKQSQWTQQIYRRKCRFQNPLHQNRLHVSALSRFLGLTDEHFLPVVFFIGNCELKTAMPTNVLTRGLISWIQGHTTERIGESARLEIVQRLDDLDRSTDRKAAARAHVVELRKRKAA